MLKPLVFLSANVSWYLYNFRKNLIRRLSDAGYRPAVLSGEDRYSRLFQVEHQHIPIKSIGKNPLDDLRLYRTYTEIYNRYKPDLILNFTLKPNIYSTLAASRQGIHVINSITGLGEVFTNNDLVSMIVKNLYKISQVKADYIFFQNREDLELFRELKILKKPNYDILPGSGIDTESFYFSDLSQRDHFVFLFLGRFLEKKGVRDYMDAAERIKMETSRVEFHMLGFPDVNDPRALSPQEVRNRQDSGTIRFLGETADVRPYIRNADCIVLPSYYREGIPRSLLEALSMGRPIITTDNTGCRDVVNDDVNGFMCQPEDVESLVHAMRKMLGLSYEKRLQMGRNGREITVEMYDEHIVLDKYIKVIQNLI